MGRQAPVSPIEPDNLELETLLVRLYGIDVPREQVTIREKARRLAQKTVLEQMVQITLLQLKKKPDQMVPSRDEDDEAPTEGTASQDVLASNKLSVAVGVVELVAEKRLGGRRKNEEIGRLLRYDLTMVLAREGLAQIRTGSMREFYNRRGALDHAMNLAKRENKGVWAAATKKWSERKLHIVDGQGHQHLSMNSIEHTNPSATYFSARNNQQMKL